MGRGLWRHAGAALDHARPSPDAAELGGLASVAGQPHSVDGAVQGGSGARGVAPSNGCHAGLCLIAIQVRVLLKEVLHRGGRSTTAPSSPPDGGYVRSDHEGDEEDGDEGN
jgi:hypothetical protein